MVKKVVKYIWSRLAFYRIFLLAFWGIFLYWLRNYLFQFLIHKWSLTTALKGVINMALYILFALFWLYTSFITLRNRRYYKLTRRDFFADSAKYYPRRYHELVDTFHPATIAELDVESLPKMTWAKSQGIIFGKKGHHLISYEPGKDGYLFCAWGEPGCGKSSSVIIPTCICFSGGAFVLDLKGEIHEKVTEFGRKNKIKRFSLLDPSHSAHFDPLINVRNAKDDEREELLGTLSIIIIPNEESKDAMYFITVARAFFMGIFLLSIHKAPDASFAEICEEIPKHPFSEWGSIIEKSGYGLASKYTNRFRDENPSNVGGGYSKLVDSLTIYTNGILRNLLTNTGEQINPADLDRGDTDIYIQVAANKVDYYHALLGMLFETFIAETLEHRTLQDRQEKGKAKFHPCAFIIDEFGQLPYMPSLIKMAQLGRGFSCNILLSTQSIGSIDTHYGSGNRKTLLDCTKGHIFLSIKDPDTQKWASELIGKHTVPRLSTTVNNGTTETMGSSYNNAEEPIYSPSEFGRLTNEDAVIIFLAGQHVKGEKTYYFK